MFDIHRVEKQIGDTVISIETGLIAKQAHGAVVVQRGETIVLVTAVTAPPKSEDIDYFPLSVDYREKYSAAGKFPGGFMKREGRPSTKEILTARMIDRPIRPLFPDSYFNEVQILVSVISADQDNDPDVLAMIGASAALTISKIPFLGPLGACRLSRVDGKFTVFPTYSQRDSSDFNLVLAGRQEAINMIEIDARQVPEDVVAQAVTTAHETIGQICSLINDLKEKCGQEKEVPLVEIDENVASQIKAKVTDKLQQAYQIQSKTDRNAAVKETFDAGLEQFCEPRNDEDSKCTSSTFRRVFDNIQKEIIRQLILKGKRLDGRTNNEIRPIDCRVAILPRAHGSALFTRGETQALVSVTLGTGQDEQTIDGLVEEYGQKFMLHYNFPPSSVGEVRFIRGPGRREIGHGALAEKALQQVRPLEDDFPYTVKIVSDITESNGSSSMASVCGGCLALMDAGIPILKPVAGISIGMVTDQDKTILLTDIIGEEDHFGEMDFKVAGTRDGITAIQLDIKAEGLPHDIMVQALEEAKNARLKILDTMAKTISESRPDLSVYAPKITSIKIDPELIGKIIGPGGKMIKSIQEQTGSKIEIEDDGTVCISCIGGQGHLEARDIIEEMTTPPQVGKIYKNSKVVSVKDFGVFVEFVPGIEGLCHISELSSEYVKNIESVCKTGDLIPVKLLLIDPQGRFKLSRKAALAELETKQNTKQKNVDKKEKNDKTVNE